MAISGPFLDNSADPDPFTPKRALQTALEAGLGSSASASQAGVALVDFTGGNIDFAGLNLDVEHSVFSLSKIAILYAAYRLRERVRTASAGITAASPSEMWAKLEAAWRPTVTAKMGKAPFDFPQFARIFTAAGKGPPWNVEFRDKHDPWAALDKLDPKLDGTSVADAEAEGFVDRLRLMIAYSDNTSAGLCVRDLGFQYLNGSLRDEGLYKNGRGLYIGGDFNLNRGPKMGDDAAGKTQGATARTVARFLTLLKCDKLVDSGSSDEMRGIMNYFGKDAGENNTRADGSPRRLHGSGSFFYGALRTPPPPRPGEKRPAARPITGLCRKIGTAANGSALSEAMLVERAVGSRVLKYAAVILGAPPELFERAALLLDDIVLNANP